MSILDWSDPDEMLGLLVEYLRDELTGTVGDPRRVRFLRALLAGVDQVVDAGSSPGEAVLRLGDISAAQPAEFEDDPALRHLRDCVEELERIAAG